jgi:hypothetical protein
MSVRIDMEMDATETPADTTQLPAACVAEFVSSSLGRQPFDQLLHLLREHFRRHIEHMFAF